MDEWHITNNNFPSLEQNFWNVIGEELSREYITKALFVLGPWKSLGPDYFPTDF